MKIILAQEVEEWQEACRNAGCGLVAMRIMLILMKTLEISEKVIHSVLGFCDRTVEKWQNRYELNGINGLEDLHREGRKSNLTNEQILEIKTHVEDSLKKEYQEKIKTAKEFEEKIKKEYQMDYSSSGLYKFLHRIGLSKLIPRPVHEKNDESKMLEWKEKFAKKLDEIKKKTVV